MTKQTKIHDGIIAVVNLVSIALAVMVDLHFLWIAGAVAMVMVSSVFTGFCPVHYSVNKLLPPPAAR
jgi:hypothetical protein